MAPFNPARLRRPQSDPAAGILAGYNPNNTNTPNNNVHGNVSIDDYASILAPTGTDGIRGVNYGTGTIAIIAEAGATITAGRYGIGAFGNDGGDVSVTNYASVTGVTAAIDVTTTLTGAVTIDNFGTIIGNVVTGGATFHNELGALWNLAGSSLFATGTNVLINEGTIDTSGTSSITTSGVLSISNAGTVNVQSGSLYIDAAVTGTGSFSISNGATLEFGSSVAAGETVSFLGTQGTLKLDHSLTSPFIGQISNLTGTALIHDNIDLADLVWNGTTSAQYAASTATSGVLTVNDGNGHTEVFNLVNYTGAGSFFVQNDGQGGTLVFDPPATTVGSAPTTMTTDAEEPLANITNVTNGGSGPHEEELVSTSDSAPAGAGYVGRLAIDHAMHSDSDMAGWHFAFDQARSSSPLSPQQTSWQSQGTELPINQLGNVVTQQIVPTLRGAADDFFAFRQETASNLTTPSDQVADKIDIDAKYAELQAIIHSSRNEHNIPDHGGGIILSNISPSHHVEGFMLNHL